MQRPPDTEQVKRWRSAFALLLPRLTVEVIDSALVSLNAEFSLGALSISDFFTKAVAQGLFTDAPQSLVERILKLINITNVTCPLKDAVINLNRQFINIFPEAASRVVIPEEAREYLSPQIVPANSPHSWVIQLELGSRELNAFAAGAAAASAMLACLAYVNPEGLKQAIEWYSSKPPIGVIPVLLSCFVAPKKNWMLTMDDSMDLV